MKSDLLFLALVTAAIVAGCAWAFSTANCPTGQKPVRAVIAFTCVPN